MHKSDSHYPLNLNTGRIRDQWHSMTRTGLSPRLTQHKPEPFVEIHPEDARLFLLAANSIAKISSRWGTMLARVTISNQQQKGNLFIPIHWTQQLSSQGRVGVLVNPVTDPVSQQPESKQTPVNICPYPARHHLLILSRYSLDLSSFPYRVMVKGELVYRYHLATDQQQADLSVFAKKIFSDYPVEQFEHIEYSDTGKGIYRLACLNDEGLQAILLQANDQQLPDYGWLQSLFQQESIDATERLSLLSGYPPSEQADVGQIVCSCFNVGIKTIHAAINEKKLNTVAQIGKECGAGTGCGSCVAELKSLLVKDK